MHIVTTFVRTYSGVHIALFFKNLIELDDHVGVTVISVLNLVFSVTDNRYVVSKFMSYRLSRKIDLPAVRELKI